MSCHSQHNNNNNNKPKQRDKQGNTRLWAVATHGWGVLSQPDWFCEWWRESRAWLQLACTRCSGRAGAWARNVTSGWALTLMHNFHHDPTEEERREALGGSDGEMGGGGFWTHVRSMAMGKSEPQHTNTNRTVYTNHMLCTNMRNQEELTWANTSTLYFEIWKNAYSQNYHWFSVFVVKTCDDQDSICFLQNIHTG